MRILSLGVVALFAVLISGTAVVRAADFNDGLAAYLDSNYEAAMGIWLPMAEGGDAGAQFAVGLLHEQGQGVAVDPATAARWYRRAADQGNADAQLSLGSLHASGTGVSRNQAEAARWFGAAARQSNPQALYKLAEAYLFGTGVNADRDYAAELLRTASDLGYGRARARLDMLSVPLDGPRADIMKIAAGDAGVDGELVATGDGAASDPGAGGVSDAPPQTETPQSGEKPDQSAAVKADAPETSARTDAAEVPVRVHIASFRSEKGAERGWEMLKKAHGDLLGELGLELRKVDFGSGMGVFYRVQVGPLDNEGAAKALCQELKSRGLYCAVAFL